MHDRRTAGGRGTAVRLKRLPAALLPAGVALALSVAAPAEAARPFFTEDADIIERGACEVEAVAAGQRARGASNEDAASAQLACGVGHASELALGAARLARGDDHWPALGIGGKTGLRPAAGGGPGVTLAYSLAGERLPGAAFRSTRAAASVVATTAVQSTLVHGNLGFAHDRVTHAGSATWAFAVEKTGERLDFGGEIFGESTRSAWVGAGGRYAFERDRLSLDASVAIRSNSARPRRASVGVTFAF